MAVDAPAEWYHRARVEHGEIGEPAPKDQVHLNCEVIQGAVGASMQPPGRYPAAHVGQFLRGRRRQEIRIRLLPFLVESLTGTKRVPAERERHLVKVLAAFAVLAV